MQLCTSAILNQWYIHQFQVSNSNSKSTTSSTTLISLARNTQQKSGSRRCRLGRLSGGDSLRKAVSLNTSIHTQKPQLLKVDCSEHHQQFMQQIQSYSDTTELPPWSCVGGGKNCKWSFNTFAGQSWPQQDEANFLYQLPLLAEFKECIV